MNWLVIFLLLSPPSQAADKALSEKTKKSDFVKFENEPPDKKKAKFIKFEDDDEDEDLKAARESIVSTVKTNEEKPKEPTWAEMGGQSFTGVPRLIRQDPMTEVFFRDLRESYVIHTDSKHNANYKVFEEAAKSNRPVTFRADPVSRRIIVVDGVNGAKAPPPTPAGPAPASVGAPTKAGSR